MQRGLIKGEHTFWDLILEAGRAWQEDGDQGWTRASFPFFLIPRGSNST